MISEFAKEKVFWTRKMNLKLVKFIERRPHIWNPKHPKYTSVAIRDQTYADFADKYGNEFTGQAVKDRWTNIRSTFANYLRKIKQSRTKSNGEEYKVNWHLWDSCQFLLKINKGEKTEYNGRTISEDEDIYRDMVFHDCDNGYDGDKPAISCRSIAKNLVDVLKNVQNDSLGLDNSKYGIVGRTVTRKLNEMDPMQSAEAIQKITDILLMYNSNNPMNPNNFKMENV